LLGEDLIEAMIDAVVVIDLAGRVILTNTAAATLSGYSPSELGALFVGQLFEDAVSGVRTRVRNKIAAGDPLRREEAWLVTKAGERVPVSIMASPITGKGDPEIVLVARDARETRRLLIERDAEIARRREVEAQLRLLAGSVGHELRNILQVQVNSIDEIQHAIEAGNTTEVSVILSDLQRVSDHLVQHAKQLLQLAKPKRELVERLSIGEIVQDVTKMLQRAGRLRGITVELVDREPSPQIRASRPRIEQIFVNLILNGAEAITPPGTISITIAARPENDRVEVTVLDTGSGIPPELLGKIFEPYFSTKGDDGTGLGLSIVCDLVEGYGGSLTVASTVGEGTTFKLVLPLDRTAQTTVPS
jgi:PAS domain S-box-containing protein